MKRTQVKAKQRRRVARTAPAQHPIAGFNLQSHVPSRYPEFPRQLQFSSRWTQTALVDLSSGNYTRRVGLFDFLNQVPEYGSEMFALYRYCRIVGVDIHLQVAGEDSDNITNTAYEAAIARIPYDQSLSPTPQQLRLVRGSQYKLASIAGMNRISLRHHYGSFDELGNPVYSRDYWQNETEAANIVPPDPSRGVIAVSVGSTVSQAAVVSINLTVTYHMQWFELMFKLITTNQALIDFEAIEERSVSIGKSTRKDSEVGQSQKMNPRKNPAAKRT